MSWQLLLAANIFLTSIGTLLQKLIMKDDKSDPAASAVFFMFLSSILTGLWLVASNQLDFSGMENIIPNLIAVMVLIGGFYLFIFKALKLIDASKFIVLLSARPLLTIITATILLGEGLVLKQYIGVLAILIGIIIVTLDRLSVKFGKGEMFALLAAFCLGLAGTNDRIALKAVNIAPYIFLSSVLPGIFLILTQPSSLKKINYFFNQSVFLKMFLMTFVQLLTILALLGALKYGENASQIASMSEFNVILTVILGIVLLGERENLLKKLVGSGLAVIGLLLVG